MMFYSHQERAREIGRIAAERAAKAGLASQPAREVGNYARSLVMAGESGWRSLMASQDMVSWLTLATWIEPMRRGFPLSNEEIETAILERAAEYAEVRLGNRCW
jgi:hypothetical protein